MSAREQQRAWILTRACEGAITLEEAAELMGTSIRHARRLKAAITRAGPAALAHGNRGRPTPRRTDSATAERIAQLYRTRYAGTNIRHFTELLAEREQLAIALSTVRRVLRAAGLTGPRTRRVPAHRRRRERAAQAGLLLQLDGSCHHWLGDRGPQITLLGAIDDATGAIAAALFRDREDSQGYFLLLEQIVRTLGLPTALYHDGHSIFVHTKRHQSGYRTIAEQLTGRVAPTQFGRLLEELGIGAITAKSPQAKGRVERLWGTLQDRLVTELRLAGASTMAEANQVLAAYLPRFNATFAVPAAIEASAYRPVPPGLIYERLFCFKYVRTVAADNTVRLGMHRIQLLADQHRISYAKAKVEIQIRMDGAVAVYHDGRLLASEPAPLEAPVLRIQGSRITYTLPPSPRPVRPLPLDEAHRRMHPHSLENGIIRAPGTAVGPPLPGRNHPWHKPISPRRERELESESTALANARRTNSLTP